MVPLPTLPECPEDAPERQGETIAALKAQLKERDEQLQKIVKQQAKNEMLKDPHALVIDDGTEVVHEK